MFDPSLAELTRLNRDELAGLVEANHTELVERENEVLVLAAAWADWHDAAEGTDYSPLVERATVVGGPGTPAIEEFCCAELGAIQGVGFMAGRAMIADALDLRHRLPRLWERVRSASVRGWQARKVAQETRHLSYDAAREVDAALADHLGTVPWPRFVKILAATIVAADPEQAAERSRRTRADRDVFAFDSEDGLKTLVARAAAGDVVWFLAAVDRIAEILAVRGDTDPVNVRRSKAIGLLARPAEALALLVEHQHDPTDHAQDLPEPDDAAPHDSLDLSAAAPGPDLRAARPRVVLHFHLSEAVFRQGYGVVRPEHGDAIILDELRTFLADTGCHVTVRPVFVPADVEPVDGYEIPAGIRFAVRFRENADVFPYATCTSTRMDLDHSTPYRPDGGPGQTAPDKLGPLGRTNHRIVTFGAWQRAQPDSGTYVWRSPTGRVFVVTNQGTLRLGKTAFSEAVWRSSSTADPG